MNLRFALLSSSVAFTLAAVACGGISDPTRNGDGRVATVSGALTGISVPANARVALVYRKIVTNPSDGPQATVEVGSDVAVVDGKFTMNVGAPSADYFASIEGRSFSGSSESPPSVSRADVPQDPSTSLPPSGGSSGSSGAFGVSTKLAPRDIVGGQITQPIAAALAGFIVYADTNGNGKLDLEGQAASSSDEILGGNSELILVYLQGGGTLDYEKLRDKSGILPVTGFNLAWSEGRWLPLNLVELKLTSSTHLPSAVCDSYSVSYTGSSSGTGGIAPSPVPVADSSGGSGSSGSSGSIGTSSGGSGTAPYGGYPSSTDPSLICSSDGRSYTYTPPVNCPAPAPQPVGLCSSGVYETTACAGGSYRNEILPGDPVPAGWPCPVADALDGGAADAAIDAGSADGG